MTDLGLALCNLLASRNIIPLVVNIHHTLRPQGGSNTKSLARPKAVSIRQGAKNQRGPLAKQQQGSLTDKPLCFMRYLPEGINGS